MKWRTLPRPARWIIIALFGSAVIAPLPYSFIAPSKAQDIFAFEANKGRPALFAPAAIQSKINGKLYLLSILVTNPDTPLIGAEVIGAWIKGDYVVVPRSVIYPPSATNATQYKVSRKEMKGSQSASKVAALAFLAKYYPEDIIRIENILKRKIADSDITFSLRGTGGPSGGLMFALGVVDLLSAQDFLQGRSVAGTGTIDTRGVVGPIGGIREKAISAKRAGATLFFAPTQNCEEVADAPQGLTVIGVDTLDQAVGYLSGRWRGNTCASVGA